MKKIIASAVGLMLAGGVAATTASAAIDNQFGGYWRTRFTYEDNFDGQKSPSRFYVDQRTRLFYTAKFSDDFKFVNKFEFNSTWGDATGVAGTGAGGDLGADGKGNWRIKNSYADFNVGPMFNAKVGIQGFTVARGFIFDDDASGFLGTVKAGMATILPFWIVANDKSMASWDGAAASAFDQNILGAIVALKVNDAVTVSPYFVYHMVRNNATIADCENWYLGADVDAKFGQVSAWGTGIYEGGKIATLTNKAFLVAAGADAGLVHGQAFYASGDDNKTDTDNNSFLSAPGLATNPNTGGPGLSANVGSSYYWSEIMGYGVFDNLASHGSPADDITDIWAANVGVTFKPMDKLKITGDYWYASLAKDNAAGEKSLGNEFDVNIAYNIYDNLTVEAIAAYLVSGKATGPENVTEGGVRLSLKF